MRAMACATTGRDSPPLLFGLAPRGVCRASAVASGAVGSYPTISPLPDVSALVGRARGFPRTCHRGRTHRRFIFCGTFRSGDWSAQAVSLYYQIRPLALPGALPCGVRTFLPHDHDRSRSHTGDRLTCPPTSIIRRAARLMQLSNKWSVAHGKRGRGRAIRKRGRLVTENKSPSLTA